MNNDLLDKALEETWKNKEKFFEENKGLSMSEIVRKIEHKYKERGTVHNNIIYASTLKRPGVQSG